MQDCTVSARLSGLVTPVEYTCLAFAFFAMLHPSLYCTLLCIDTDRLCGLVVRVSGYRSRGPGFDSRRFQIF
jgi:hypothetical protein